MTGFAFHPATGRLVATLTGFEADMLRSLAGQLVELLHNESAVPAVQRDPLEELLDFSGPVTEPEDPVLQRLFPSAYEDDDEAAAEFRRFTEGTLRDGKARSAASIIDALDDAGLPPQLDADGLVLDIELEPGEAEVWLRSFTDIRLAVAVRLGVEEDDDAYWEGLEDQVEAAEDRGEDPGEPAHLVQVHQIYQWLGWLQESLVEALESALAA